MVLKGKKAVLTGASSGIGLELLKLLLGAGVSVVAASRNMESSAIEHHLLFKVNCDVSSPESLDNLFQKALEQLGGIDIFIANAGFAYYEKQSKPDWDHISSIFNTNILGLIYCAQKMKTLKGDNPYNFLCTASAMSHLSIPGYALYSSTKAAIRGYADASRFELKKEQHFQVAFPVATKTNFFQTAGENPPVPWPALSAAQVARSILRGIERNRPEIYPSLLFRSMLIINNYIPLIFPLYKYNENKKLNDWIDRQSPAQEQKELL